MMVAMPNYNNLAGRDVAGLAFSLIFLECLRFVCVCVCVCVDMEGPNFSVVNKGPVSRDSKAPNFMHLMYDAG